MNRSLLLLFTVTLLVGVALAKGGRKPSNGKPGKHHPGKGSATAAPEMGGDWTWGECVPRKGDCGKGAKTGTCSGTNCTSQTAKKQCRVRCPETETAPETEPETEPEPEAQVTDATAATGEELATELPRRGGKGKGGKKPAKTGGKGGKGGKGGRGGRQRPGKPGRGKTEPGTNCTYGKPVLSECDPETNRQNRTRTLVSGDPALCQDVITVPGRCNRAEARQENKNCMYNWVLSDCDAETNTLALTGALVNVEGAPSNCEVAVSRELACRDGKARCRLGEWGEYSECADGIQTRTRTVRKGGKACEKLAKEHMTC